MHPTAEPGIKRRRSGKGFSYTGVDGMTIRDKSVVIAYSLTRLFHLLGRMCGSAPTRMDTCRPRGVTHEAGSRVDTIPDGEKSAMRIQV